MNLSTAIFLVNTDVQLISVRYTVGGTFYSFKTYDKTLEIGDYVVVPNSHNNFPLKIAQVTAVGVAVNFEAPYDYQWIVHRATLAVHEKVVAQEAELIQKLRDAENLHKLRQMQEALLTGGLGDIADLEIVNVPLSRQIEDQQETPKFRDYDAGHRDDDVPF